MSTPVLQVRTQQRHLVPGLCDTVHAYSCTVHTQARSADQQASLLTNSNPADTFCTSIPYKSALNNLTSLSRHGVLDDASATKLGCTALNHAIHTIICGQSGNIMTPPTLGSNRQRAVSVTDACCHINRYCYTIDVQCKPRYWPGNTECWLRMICPA